MMNYVNFTPKQRILDFSKCRYLGEMHQVIQQELELPTWYGQNLDALWDSITGLMYLPADILIIDKPEKKRADRLTFEINKICNLFQEAAQSNYGITFQTER